MLELRPAWPLCVASALLFLLLLLLLATRLCCASTLMRRKKRKRIQSIGVINPLDPLHSTSAPPPLGSTPTSATSSSSSCLCCCLLNRIRSAIATNFLRSCRSWKVADASRSEQKEKRTSVELINTPAVPGLDPRTAAAKGRNLMQASSRGPKILPDHDGDEEAGEDEEAEEALKLWGSLRLLFTIAEETEEDMDLQKQADDDNDDEQDEQEDGDSSGGIRRSDLQCIIPAISSPYLTPSPSTSSASESSCSDPCQPFATPLGSPAPSLMPSDPASLSLLLHVQSQAESLQDVASPAISTSPPPPASAIPSDFDSSSLPSRQSCSSSSSSSYGGHSRKHSSPSLSEDLSSSSSSAVSTSCSAIAITNPQYISSCPSVSQQIGHVHPVVAPHPFCLVNIDMAHEEDRHRRTVSSNTNEQTNHGSPASPPALKPSDLLHTPESKPPSMEASQDTVFTLPPLPRPSTPSPFRHLFHLRPEYRHGSSHSAHWTSHYNNNFALEDGRSHYWRRSSFEWIPEAKHMHHHHRHHHMKKAPSSVCSEDDGRR